MNGDEKNDLDRIAERIVSVELLLCGLPYQCQRPAVGGALVFRTDDFALALAELDHLRQHVVGLAATHHSLARARVASGASSS